jgi:ureidoacrylate peracid hydrolase
MSDELDPKRTALLTIDLQNDFLHPEGAYGRAGQGSEAIAALPARIRPVADALRAKGGTYISAQFTLVPGPGGEPLIAPHLKKLRPFLGKGDFAPGASATASSMNSPPPITRSRRWPIPPFYQTRLEYILRALDIDTLIVGGIVTNGGVASTVRDAHLRNIHTILLSDGCAAFKPEVHDATLVSLGSITPIVTCAEMLEELS